MRLLVSVRAEDQDDAAVARRGDSRRGDAPDGGCVDRDDRRHVLGEWRKWREVATARRERVDAADVLRHAHVSAKQQRMMNALTAYVERTLKACARFSRACGCVARARAAPRADAATRYQAAWRGRHARGDGGEQMRLAADAAAIGRSALAAAAHPLHVRPDEVDARLIEGVCRAHPGESAATSRASRSRGARQQRRRHNASCDSASRRRPPRRRPPPGGVGVALLRRRRPPTLLHRSQLTASLAGAARGAGARSSAHTTLLVVLQDSAAAWSATASAAAAALLAVPSAALAAAWRRVAPPARRRPSATNRR